MKIQHLSCSLTLPITQDVAWAFFSNPKNLEQLAPPHARFRDVSFEQPKALYSGQVQLFRLRPFGLLPLQWLAVITQVNAPHYFVDEQKRGPFAFWHHEHRITPVEGGVEIIDIVHYALPFGILGEIAHEVFFKHEIARLFQYRARMLEEFFG